MRSSGQVAGPVGQWVSIDINIYGAGAPWTDLRGAGHISGTMGPDGLRMTQDDETGGAPIPEGTPLRLVVPNFYLATGVKGLIVILKGLIVP